MTPDPTNSPASERPIIFSAPMVRAILAGKKTMTRRIVTAKQIGSFGTCSKCKAWKLLCGCYKPMYRGLGVGEHLWVKETWHPKSNASAYNEDDGSVTVKYAADGSEKYFEDDDEVVPNEWCLPKSAKQGNVSPLFMPRWASRITLEITAIRVERLGDITESDAVHEGFERREHFIRKWNELNGKKPGDSFEADPWVWCISFRKVATHV